MIKSVVAASGLSGFAIVGLLIFVATFAAIAAWALTRPRGQVRAWSELPLAADCDEPVEPRSLPRERILTPPSHERIDR